MEGRMGGEPALLSCRAPERALTTTVSLCVAEAEAVRRRAEAAAAALVSDGDGRGTRAVLLLLLLLPFTAFHCSIRLGSPVVELSPGSTVREGTSCAGCSGTPTHAVVAVEVEAEAAAGSAPGGDDGMTVKVTFTRLLADDCSTKGGA